VIWFRSNAEEYANKERIKMLVELFIDGTLSVEAATKKVGIYGKYGRNVFRIC